MGTDICFLITILYQSQGTLLQCALKVDREKIGYDVILYPMEYKDKLHSLLPPNIKNCGPIVDVSEIFEIHTVTHSDSQ